ncbi:unnamed protein product [Symbiodinium sp. KB8]|nr:unnamed protein product [Symbiodinium sp. KB8]
MARADGRRVSFCFGESLSCLKAPAKPEEILVEDGPPPTLRSSLDSRATARNAGGEHDAYEEATASFNSFYCLTGPEDMEPLSRPLEPRRFLHEKHLDALDKIRKVIELSPHRLRFSVNWRRSMEYAAEPGDVSAGCSDSTKSKSRSGQREPH